uniref:Selenoprotein P N-terminal domain-containing protein n=1 Tax=Anopheles dirus TaxID=7168 RepID=A0A182NL67_9DIPT
MMNITNSFLDETFVYLYREMNQYVPEFISSIGYVPWLYSLLGSALIGLSGILPMFIIPDATKNGKDSELSDPAESKTLKILLSFAVGGLLGDVFLHLLPETWEHEVAAGPTADGHPSLRSGLWVLGGLLLFTMVEKIFSGYANVDEKNPQPKCVEIATCLLRRSGGKLPEGFVGLCGGDGKGSCDIEDVPNGCFLAGNGAAETARDDGGHKKVAGYLNLLANSIDNFTHGLAVAGSFLVSLQHGLLATFAILLHEIPHEVGDFAILLRSGFSRWDAAKAQLLTAGAGLLGALVAIGGSGATTALEAKTSWIAPFTAGGFLHIALVTVLPDLLDESSPWESFKQFAALLLGIGLMAFMTSVKSIRQQRMPKMVWCVPVALFLLLCLGVRLGVCQEMSISEELETCSTLDRPVLERMFGAAADDFFGKITVLFNVAPPKPVQTPRVFAERDPIYYNKIDFREQIKYYHNLDRMFHGQREYRDEVRFLLSASLHRVPYELVEYNFTDFYGTVRTLAGEYNLTVYPNQLTANRTFALFGLREFQVYVIDRCSRVSYIIQPPWSLIQYAYVKAAVLSTFYDRPCGKCELENFLNSTLDDGETGLKAGVDSSVIGTTANDTRPYEDASEESHGVEEEDSDDERNAYSEEDESDGDFGGDRGASFKDDEDPFANLTVTGAELELPLRIILPVLHVHVPNENETAATQNLHQYIVLSSNVTDGHEDHPGPGQPEVELQELSLPLASNSTPVAVENDDEQTRVEDGEKSAPKDSIRIAGTDWSASELRVILNTSSILYDPKQQRVFERLRRYNLTDRVQYDEVAEISVSNRFEAWNRRRAPPKADVSRNNRRSQIKKHYARLIPWLSWTFGRAIPPAAGKGANVTRSLN